jgi:CBS domain-containing protein
MASHIPASSRLDTPVSGIMRPGVITVADDASLRQVQGAIASHRVHAVLVADEHTGRPLGWVTARRVLSLAGRDPDLTTARSAVTNPPVTISPNATAREALNVLVDSGCSHLLVCRSGDAAAEGVVSDIDLITLLSGRAT